MPITVFSPHSGNPVKVRDQDAGRAVKDEEGRIFYVLPKSDGSGYYAALTRSGNSKDEDRAREFENKVAQARGTTQQQVEAAQFKPRSSGKSGKILVGSAVIVVLGLGTWFAFSAKSMWQTGSVAPPPPPKAVTGEGMAGESQATTLDSFDAEPIIGAPKPAHDPKDPDLLILPSGLEYKTTHPGTGAQAQYKDRVQIKYTGWLANGTEFESTSGQDTEFMLTVGAKRNLPFWNQAIPGMTEGEVRTFIVPPDLAYGSQGSAIVPPNETLKYQVELVRVIHAAAQ